MYRLGLHIKNTNQSMTGQSSVVREVSE